MTAPTPEQPAPTPSATTDPNRELCDKCGYTFAGHVSNTGVLHPCWTPSGRYHPVPPASAPAATAGEPDTYQMAGDVLAGKRRIEDVLAELRPAATAGKLLDANTASVVVPIGERTVHVGLRPAAPSGEEAETPITMREVNDYALAYLTYVRRSREALTFDAEQALRDEYSAARDRIESRLTAQATELAALRARVEELEAERDRLADTGNAWLTARNNEPLWMGAPDEKERAEETRLAYREHVRALCAAIASRRAALAPRQTTEGQP